MPLIRPSRDGDIAAITALYAHHVLHGTGTFETTAPSAAEMAARRAEVLARGLPWLVAVDSANEADAADGGRLLGFAYCNWFRPREAYRHSAEDSIYVAPEAAGQGLGSALLAELEAQAARVGMRKLIAVIGDSANTASIALHRRAGFAAAGTIAACGWKGGRWLDVVLMDKALGAGAATDPQAQPAHAEPAAAS